MSGEILSRIRISKSPSSVLAALGACQAICYLYILELGKLNTRIIPCMAAFLGAFVLYCAFLAVLKNCIPAKQQTKRPGRKNYPVVLIAAFALCFRIIMLFSPASLSDDVYRYVWEGKIFSAGYNPFAIAPEDPQLEPLRDAVIFPGVTRKNLTAIYPPVSQFIFAACAFISPTILAMKITFVIFDLATIAVLLLTLQALGMGLHRIAIYALNPLVIMEFAGSGHLDSAGIFFLMLALYLFTRKKNLSPLIALAAAFLVKLLPILFLPFILRRKKLAGLLLFAALCLIACGPFLSAGNNLWQSLGIYAQHWYFNAPAHDLLMELCRDSLLARKAAALIFCAALSALYLQHFRKSSAADAACIYRVCFLTLVIFYLLTATLHPWYVCWIVPFLVIVPGRALLLFSGTVFLSYWVLKEYAASGIWEEQPAIKILEYVPCALLFFYDRIRAHSCRKEARP